MEAEPILHFKRSELQRYLDEYKVADEKELEYLLFYDFAVDLIIEED